MPFPSRTYYFGRLNLIASYTDKKEYLWDGFKPNIVVQERGNNWTFTERESLLIESEAYIYCILTKYRDDFYERVDPEVGQVLQEETRNESIAKSKFFIHVRSGIIAYQTVSQQVNDSQFKKIFCGIFEKAHGNLFVNAEIQTIEERYELFEKLSEFDCITSISLMLHPSNPFSRSEWDEFDQDLKALDAATYYEKYSAKEGHSLKIDEIGKSEKIKGKITMALDGYGLGVIKGKVKDVFNTLTTGKNPITVKILDRDRIKETIEPLHRKIKEIIDDIRGKDE